MSENLKALQKRGAEILKNSGIDSAAFEVRLLLEQTFSVSYADIITNPKLEPDRRKAGRFISACQRRANGEPLQYILGSWEFMGLEFEVNPSVLIPRSDTETLVEYIIERYSGAPRVLDICCGSGCIGLAVKHFLPESRVTLADKSARALTVAERNACKLGLDVKLIQADVTRSYKKYFADGEFDIIVSNPPYIKSSDMEKLPREVLHEPRIALDGGEDGMTFYRALAIGWAGALKADGEMIFEAGYDTARDIYMLFAECGFRDINKKRDLGGITRLIAAKRGFWE